MAEPKKLFIKTFGCQMNVYDSERMADALGQSGYSMTSQAEDADLVLLNTCHIREKAGQKVYSDLGRLKKLKQAKPDLRIGVAGCVAQAEGAEIFRRMPMVDLVVGPQAYHRLPAMAEKAARGNKVIDTEFPQEDKFEHLPQDKKRRAAASAFLTVQEGCDKFCAFCVVPYTRGAEVSRQPDRDSARGPRSGRPWLCRNHSARTECECLSRRCGWAVDTGPIGGFPDGNRWSAQDPIHDISSQ